MNRAKQQREKKRQNARAGRYFINLRGFYTQQITAQWLKSSVIFPYGQPALADAMDMQSRFNELTRISHKYISGSSSMSERDRRIAELTDSPIRELQKRLTEEMMSAGPMTATGISIQRQTSS